MLLREDLSFPFYTYLPFPLWVSSFINRIDGGNKQWSPHRDVIYSAEIPWWYSRIWRKCLTWVTMDRSTSVRTLMSRTTFCRSQGRNVTDCISVSNSRSLLLSVRVPNQMSYVLFWFNLSWFEDTWFCTSRNIILSSILSTSLALLKTCLFSRNYLQLQWKSLL